MSGRIGHAVEVAAGLRWLDTVLAGGGDFLELRVLHDDGTRGKIWPPAGGKWLAHYVELLESINAGVDVVLAKPARQVEGIRRFPVLWCRVESKPAADKLRAFRPRPSFVFREGTSSRYTALWALGRPLTDEDEVIRANERLSFAMGGRRGAANPYVFEFAPPGSVIRQEGKRAVPVLFGRCSLDVFAPEDVVGRLRDAPDLEAVRERIMGRS